MAWFIITNRKSYFKNIGEYNYCSLDEMNLDIPKIACDTETTSLRTYLGDIFAIQLATYNNAYLIDLETIKFSDVWKLIKNKVLVFHNSKFDLGWFYKYGYFPWKVRDTYLSSKILHNGLVQVKHGLGYVMERELGLFYDKSAQENIAKTKLSTKKAIQYCFNDVDKLLELDDALNKKIIEGGYLNAYQLHRRWIRALAYMEQCGVPLPVNNWKKKIESDKKELIVKEKVIIDYIYKHFPEYRQNQIDMFTINENITISISSPIQMIPVFKKLGINVIDSEGKESTAEDVVNKTKHEFVDIWLEYKSIAHDVSTFGENFLPSIYQERLYTSYSPIMDTARISAGGGKKKKGEIKLINTLNFPKGQKTRQCVEALPGYKYIVCDYSGQETRTGADITGDEAMISSIINSSCLHCAFVRVLHPELEELSDEEIIKNHSDKRQNAKAPRFCLN